MEYLTDELKREVAGRILEADRVFFFLDYDGTLTPIMPHPGMARLRGATRDILDRLSRKRDFTIGIITGRECEQIQAMVGLKGIIYAANDGLELEGPNFSYTHSKAKKSRKLLEEVLSHLKPMAKLYPGAFIEDKGVSLSFHYRLAGERNVPALKKGFFKKLSSWTQSNKLRITEVKKAFEILPEVRWDKGAAVLWILLKEGSDTLPVYLGDDTSDEYAFAALRDRGVTIKVGNDRDSCARYFIKDVNEVERFLSYMSCLKKES